MINLMEQECFKINTKFLLIGLVGSQAYGTATEESDEDYMGVALAPLSYYTGLDQWQNEGTKEFKKEKGDEYDAVVYELKKFFKLCLGFNPNVIPLLYLPKYKYATAGGMQLVYNADIFVSKYAYDTFIGYAKSQLSNVKKGITGKYGAKRKELIQKYGYDVKFAMHTIRLLTMINEFFSTGKMSVNRGSDIPHLLDIRHGKITEKEFFQEAEFLLSIAQGEFEKATWIPDKPDFKRANELCMDIIEDNKFYA